MTKPDYEPEYPWHGFTDQQLSMIASTLAGGGAFCCRYHERERQTVTASPSRQERLDAYAHENLGCRWRGERGGAAETDEHWKGRSALYLERFLHSV